MLIALTIFIAHIISGMILAPYIRAYFYKSIAHYESFGLNYKFVAAVCSYIPVGNFCIMYSHISMYSSIKKQAKRLAKNYPDTAKKLEEYNILKA